MPHCTAHSGATLRSHALPARSGGQSQRPSSPLQLPCTWQPSAQARPVDAAPLTDGGGGATAAALSMGVGCSREPVGCAAAAASAVGLAACGAAAE